MSEIVVPASSLPKQILQFFHTELVTVQAESGEVRLVPLASAKKYNCPFLGKLKNSGITIDGYLREKEADKDLE